AARADGLRERAGARAARLGCAPRRRPRRPGRSRSRPLRAGRSSGARSAPASRLRRVHAATGSAAAPAWLGSREGGGVVIADEAYAEVERITRKRARNFAYGIMLLPKPKRRALAAVYAFAREVDDIADDPELPVAA